MRLIVLTFTVCFSGLSWACVAAQSRNAACDLHSLDEVISNPVASDGKVLCANVLAMSYSRSARILANDSDVPPSNDLAMLVSHDTRTLLRGLTGTPHSFYVVARIAPDLPCFAPSDSEEGCSPYQRPLVFHIIAARANVPDTQREARAGNANPSARAQ